MRKDRELLKISAEGYNIPRFICITPDGFITSYRIDFKRDVLFHGRDIPQMIAELFSVCDDRTLNVRTFTPEQPSGNPFDFGLTNVKDVLKIVEKRGEQGLYSLVVETVDVNDSGIPGCISQGGIVEILYGDTIRGVEKADTFSMPAWMAEQFFHLIYDVEIPLVRKEDKRIEFSVHPKDRGFYRSKWLTWEIGPNKSNCRLLPEMRWPNSYSKFLGDKAFGLIVAHLLGFNVPYTEVIHRSEQLDNFMFGTLSTTADIWLRTCPAVKTPGFFPTEKNSGKDFRKFLSEKVPSFIMQDGINAVYSGACITDDLGEPIIEGVYGEGDDFMQGNEKPGDIEIPVRTKVKKVFYLLQEKGITTPYFEWVYDGSRVWIVQLGWSSGVSRSNTVFPGVPNDWVEFFPQDQTLEELRDLIRSRKGRGIKIMGHCGITSHIADVLRQNKIPSIILNEGE